jgi:hypothetical protein
MCLRQLQPKIQIRFEDVRLGFHRLSIRGNRFFQMAEGVFRESEIEPGHIVVRVAFDQLPQQRLGIPKILLADQLLCLRKLRRGTFFFGYRGVMSCWTGFVIRAGGGWRGLRGGLQIDSNAGTRQPGPRERSGGHRQQDDDTVLMTAH